MIKTNNNWDKRTRREWNIFAAAGNGRIDVLQKLLRKGGDMNAKQDSTSALYHAILHNQLRCAEFLLKHGAKVNDLASGQHSHLYTAVQCRSEAALDLLYRYKANGACFDAGDAVVCAMENKDYGILHKLIRHGAPYSKALKIAVKDKDWKSIRAITRHCTNLHKSWFSYCCMELMDANNKATLDITQHIIDHSGNLEGEKESMIRLALCIQSTHSEWVRYRKQLWWMVRKAIEKGAPAKVQIPKDNWVQFFFSREYVSFRQLAYEQNSQHIISHLLHKM